MVHRLMRLDTCCGREMVNMKQTKTAEKTKFISYEGSGGLAKKNKLYTNLLSIEIDEFQSVLIDFKIRESHPFCINFLVRKKYFMRQHILSFTISNGTGFTLVHIFKENRFLISVGF